MAKYIVRDDFPASIDTVFPKDGSVYCALAVASDSEIDLFEVDLPGLGAARISPSAPLLVPDEAREGPIRVSAVRGGLKKGAVVAATCMAEVGAIARKRSPWVRRPGDLGDVASDSTAYTFTITTGTDVVISIPFAGRRHAAIVIENEDGADAVSYTVGAKVNELAGETAETATVSLVTATTVSAGATVGQHIGGTNEEEVADSLELTITTAGTGVGAINVWVDVFGELGD